MTHIITHNSVITPSPLLTIQGKGFTVSQMTVSMTQYVPIHELQVLLHTISHCTCTHVHIHDTQCICSCPFQIMSFSVCDEGAFS